ncbi:dienelactone hydrolase family protein [Rhodocytophaga aerolata]|uniref:Dienelactone hydrolase family protein n=1 Tax=Rhodocytophaga aerolata TaxID=455078 RepID=A0ABT8R9L1_9BACT|nr:dienelactone hydrolase family protein [Rhodocytophaga aerolata]MDO1448770.1 dienelactone hydrolase family protein [Rhodocytophaga aerolata]
MAGTMVSFKSNGSTASGYLATSESGKGPGIIVIQEWWGLVDHIKDVCNRFAKAGFTALAPDLYDGKATKSPDDAGKMMMALNIDEAAKKLNSAIEYLSNHEGVSTKKIGVVGFCMGGQLALYAATINTKVGATVDYYGIHPSVNPDFSKLEGPVLGFFGEKDKTTPKEAVEALEEKLKSAGKTYSFTIYPGTSHAFFNDTRPEVYNREAATDTWQKMIAFFKESF